MSRKRQRRATAVVAGLKKAGFPPGFPLLSDTVILSLFQVRWRAELVAATIIKYQARPWAAFWAAF